jgi:hypothetical protein
MHPAPQIKLLKLLGLLGAGDQGAAENMYGVIGAAMQKAALHGNTIGNAIVYEAARAITNIYPNANLLQSGACMLCFQSAAAGCVAGLQAWALITVSGQLAAVPTPMHILLLHPLRSACLLKCHICVLQRRRSSPPFCGRPATICGTPASMCWRAWCGHRTQISAKMLRCAAVLSCSRSKSVCVCVQSLRSRSYDQRDA